MTQIEKNLDHFRPAEVFWLIKPGLASPEALFRDTLTYLLSSSVLRLKMEERILDPATGTKYRLPILSKGPAFDSHEARSYETPLLDHIHVRGESGEVIRNFVTAFRGETYLLAFKESIAREMQKNGLIKGRGLLGFLSKTRLGKEISKEAKSLYGIGKSMTWDLDNGTKVSEERIRDLFSRLKHHLILLDEFPFRRLKGMGKNFESLIGFQDSFFSDENPDFPDFDILLNINPIDTAIFTAFRKPSVGTTGYDSGSSGPMLIGGI